MRGRLEADRIAPGLQTSSQDQAEALLCEPYMLGFWDPFLVCQATLIFINQIGERTDLRGASAHRNRETFEANGHQQT